MCSIDAVIFDLDGTLVDTLDDLTASVGVALGTVGLPPAQAEQIRLGVGSGAGALIRSCLPQDKRHLVRQVETAFRAHYDAHSLVHTRLFPGVAEVLDGLVARGVGIAVLSNKPHAPTVALVDKLLSPWPWASVRGLAELPAKPHAASLGPALRALGVHPSRVAMVGDSEADMGVARAGGLQAVGVSWGFRTEAELRRSGAEVVVHSAEALAVSLA